MPDQGTVCAAIESIHTIIVLATVEAGAKLASGGSYMGPDFDLTFANDYSATKTTQEGMLTRSEVLSATKSSGGFAIDASFSGEEPDLDGSVLLEEHHSP